MGRSKKNKTLNRNATKSIIREAKSSQHVNAAKITVKDDDDTKPEIIDLFDNVSTDYIQFSLKSRETIQTELLYNEMVKSFLVKRDELYNCLGIEK